MQSKELLVSAIKNGTVIDHITSGHALKIAQILKLAAHKKIVTIGLNLPSRAMRHKDLIKVEGRELTPPEANEVALLSPRASVNIIRNYQVTKKFTVKIPDRVDGLIVCPNPKCITNHEIMPTVFMVLKNRILRLRCAYCEKIFTEEEITNYSL